MRVFIEDIADKLDESNEDLRAFLNKKSGEMIDITSDYLNVAEELEEGEGIPNRFLDWERELIETAIEVTENWSDYVELPSQFDLNEYSIMEDFIEELEDDRKRTILFKTIQGRGAFRRFKDKICELDMESMWFSYRQKAFCQIAVEWCEDHDIQYDYREKKNG